MGYGHQRAAYPLKDIVYERIITANNDNIISSWENRVWERSRAFYEFVSRLKRVPVFGKAIFWAWDQFLKISPFFPFRDLSKPNFSVLRLKKLIKKGLCKSIIEYTAKEDISVITTHFIPALAYHYNDKKVYCIVTDSDINRAWVPDNPKKSCNIIYFSPCKHATFRLMQYGVPEQNIIETGFPLPKENIGANNSIIKKDMMARLVNLDPSLTFFNKYEGMITQQLGVKFKNTPEDLKRFKTHKLTMTYMIGGAGAQADIGAKVIASFKDMIIKDELILNIVAGTKLGVKQYYDKAIRQLSLEAYNGKNINIIFALDKKTLFQDTNTILRTTDIIWTKPSEMSFYTGLGIPIIIAPPIGAHENFNKEWLEHMGSGFVQHDPAFAADWIRYWIADGRLADAAIQGYIDAPRMGIYNIEKELFKDTLMKAEIPSALRIKAQHAQRKSRK